MRWVGRGVPHDEMTKVACAEASRIAKEVDQFELDAVVL